MMRLDGAAAQYAPNLLVNPGFEVWQRGNGPFTSAGVYTADRWQISALASGSAISVSRDTSNMDAGSAACAALAYTHGSASDYYWQPLNDQVGQLAGRTVTFSVRVKTSTANAFRLYVWDSVNGNRYGAYHPGDGAYHTLTVTAPIAATATQASAALSLEASGTVYLDNATLVVGSQPIPYVPLHPADDLHRCQRYYELLGDPASGKYLVGGGYSAGSGQVIFSQAAFKVRKAVTPTLTVVGAWTGQISTGPSVSGMDTAGAVLYVTTTGVGVAYLSNTGAGACISAEANP